MRDGCLLVIFAVPHKGASAARPRRRILARQPVEDLAVSVRFPVAARATVCHEQSVRIASRQPRVTALCSVISIMNT
jgi:hypothetical protein